MTPDIVITSIARTPQGKMLGSLKDLSAIQLGAISVKATIERAGLLPKTISEVTLGCVLPAGLGQAPARQVALNSGLSNEVSCTTINKVCGSGMKAIMLAHNSLVCGETSIMIAGGMESMTNAPYLALKARGGYRFGHALMYDHMLLDGLEDAYEKGKPMGFFAEQCAKQFQFSREVQDKYAEESILRARYANEHHLFDDEIVPIELKNKNSTLIIDKDEHPFSVDIKKIPLLPPAFDANGTITAANSSSIADGAATVMLMNSQTAKQHGIKPLCRIVGFSTHSQAPSDFPTAPIPAIKKLLDKINWKISEVDLFEINEAFAVVTLAMMKELSIPHEKLNVNGGGCALGHPIGATGARIVVTLVNALRQRQLKKGIASLCIGGGEATAIAIEIV